MWIVVTRPEPANERTTAALRARGHDVLSAPLMIIEPINADVRTDYAALVVTSANVTLVLAAHPKREQLVQLPVFAVGDRTADELRKIGFKNVVSAQGDASDLTRLIAAHKPDKGERLLYLAGENRAAELNIGGYKVDTVVVYRARTLPFPPALIAAIKARQIDLALHFSVRSATNFISGAMIAGLEQEALSLRHICLSAQVAEPLQSAHARDVTIAPRPDEAALIALIA